MANVAFAIVDGYPVTDIWLTAEDVSFVKTGRQRGIYANGGTIVSQASDGSTRISSSPQGTFPVLLNKDGGSDGSATAVITNTYSVYRNLNAVIGTDTPDGTTLSPSYNRAVFNMTTAVASSNGVVITAAASGSIGEGYIDKNGNIALYSAPEAISWGC